ncbi:MAG: hypothetical protein LM600_05380 [Thaumarchaeota archaeon]|jgi:hypothetical protein|nr:hypothetical protein [Nitrososphaerota archaeon]
MKFKKDGRDECFFLILQFFKYADELLTLLPQEQRQHFSRAIGRAKDEDELVKVFEELEKATWHLRPSDLEITVKDFIEILREYDCVE